MNDDGLRGSTGNARNGRGTRNGVDQSIRGYLQQLEQQGEMVRVTKEIDPAANMSAVGWKTYNDFKKATLFSNIKGHPDWEACTQILTDRSKWSMALDLTEDEFLPALSRKLKMAIDPVIDDTGPAPCKEVIKTGGDVSLFDLPVVTTSEEDGGPFIPAGMAIVRDPDTGIRNMSVHRLQVFDTNHTGFAMVPRQARRIYDKYRAKGETMQVAIAIGTHPAIFFGSAFTAPFGIDELALAGGLLGDPVRLVKCETVDIEVPAEAEIILEGEIVPDELRHEGPYGEVPGTYAAADDCEVLRITAITHRRRPIYYALHCGMPTTCAQAATGVGIEMATWEHLSQVEGGLDLLDVRCPPSGGLMMLVIKLRPRIAGQAKTALMASLSGPCLHPKLAVAVDDDIDANDLRQVMWSMTTRVHAEKDVTMIHNTRTFALDKTSLVPEGGHQYERVGSKWLIDATKPAITHPEERAQFAPAMPINFNSVNLEDFLPEEVFK